MVICCLRPAERRLSEVLTSNNYRHRIRGTSLGRYILPTILDCGLAIVYLHVFELVSQRLVNIPYHICILCFTPI